MHDRVRGRLATRGVPDPRCGLDVERRINPKIKKPPLASIALAALLPVILSACGGGDGLSRADVEEIVRAEMAQAPAQPTAPPALTSADVEEIVRAVISSVPSKSAPAEYTRHVVRNAIARYEFHGLEATLAHYNRPESVDGQWYVFIIDENDLVVAHPDPGRLGLDVKGWVGTDANGYEFGGEILSATEDGKWVSYVYRNPASGHIGTGDFELKNVWVERRDGLLFASGWYIDANAFTEQLVSIAVDNFREGGLPATVAYFASSDNVLAGLAAAVDYYNTTDTVEGHWFAFIGDPNGRIVAHSDPSLIGQSTAALLDNILMTVTEERAWILSESLRVYVAEYDGFVFGSGWSRDE